MRVNKHEKSLRNGRNCPGIGRRFSVCGTCCAATAWTDIWSHLVIGSDGFHHIFHPSHLHYKHLDKIIINHYTLFLKISISNFFLHYKLLLSIIWFKFWFLAFEDLFWSSFTSSTWKSHGALQGSPAPRSVPRVRSRRCSVRPSRTLVQVSREPWSLVTCTTKNTSDVMLDL